jgi:hypothetical protein
VAETPTTEEASPAASPEERLLLEGLEGPNKCVRFRFRFRIGIRARMKAGYKNVKGVSAV